MSGLFLVSVTPSILFSLFALIKSAYIAYLFVLIGSNAASLQSFGNPVLYTFTNRRFRGYVWSLLCGWYHGMCELAQRGITKLCRRRNQEISRRTGNQEENQPARIRVHANNAAMQSSRF